MVIAAMSKTNGMLSKKDSTVALALRYSCEGSAIYAHIGCVPFYVCVFDNSFVIVNCYIQN